MSAGADHHFDYDDTKRYSRRTIDDGESDLVYVDGKWVQAPFALSDAP